MQKKLLIISLVTAMLICLPLNDQQLPFLYIRGNLNFWHLQKTDAGTWWFISPEGKKEFILTVQNVQPYQVPVDPKKPYYNSDIYQKSGTCAWAAITSKRVLSYGFDGIGAWSNPSLWSYLPFERDLNILASCKRNIADFLWPQEVDRIVEREVLETRNDKNLIGYYIDNELNWNNLEPNSSRYFSTICSAIRKYDPNHLILGVRFNKRPPIQTLLASCGWVDVHSFNIYTNDAILWKNMFKEVEEICDTPIIISEFSFYSKINQSGNVNTMGFGGEVKDQKERAIDFQKIVSGAANTNFIVGTSWFQWLDEPVGGRKSDGEDVNFGIIDLSDHPYPLMIQASEKLHQTISKAHEISSNKQEANIWRDDPIRIH